MPGFVAAHLCRCGRLLSVQFLVVNQHDRYQLDGVLDAVTFVVGQGVVGVYQYGSAVLGGLRTHSDIDVFVLLDRRTRLDERRSLVEAIMPISGRRGTRISGRPIELTMAFQGEIRPWRRHPRREFQYGEWLRDDYESGFVPQPVSDPDLAPLIATLLTASKALVGPPVATLLDPVPYDDLVSAMRGGVPGLLDELDEDTTNVLLTLARIAYTISQGSIVTKDEAAAWALTGLPDDFREPLAHARLAYLGEANQSHGDCVVSPYQTAIHLIHQMIDPPPDDPPANRQ